jgi:hypothetical protein
MRGRISAPVAAVRKRRSLDEVAIGCDRRRWWYLTVQFNVSVLSTLKAQRVLLAFYTALVVHLLGLFLWDYTWVSPALNYFN